MNAQNAFTFQAPRRQNFALPFPLMNFFTFKNSNTIAYSKLIKTCKNFYAKNPIVIVNDVINGEETDMRYKLKNQETSINWTIEKMKSTKMKLWISEYIKMDNMGQKPVTHLLKKIYRFDGCILTLAGEKLLLMNILF